MATIAEGALARTFRGFKRRPRGSGVRATHSRSGWRRSATNCRYGCRSRWAAGSSRGSCLPDPAQWIAAMCALAAVALAAVAVGRHGRAGRALAIGAAVAALGIGLAWWRADGVAAPVLARPAIVTMTARVEGVEPLPARELVRLRLAPLSVEADASSSTPPRRRPGSSREDGCYDAQRSPTGRSQLGPGLRRGSGRGAKAPASNDRPSPCRRTSASTSRKPTCPPASAPARRSSCRRA